MAATAINWPQQPGSTTAIKVHVRQGGGNPAVQNLAGTATTAGIEVSDSQASDATVYAFNETTITAIGFTVIPPGASGGGPAVISIELGSGSGGGEGGGSGGGNGGEGSQGGEC